ncbi:MAG: 5-(carboxyamino)imidazole ribonucleotide synthase [Aquiluna sp.]|nr:5-(carboxyamino)imidazole ribonucleotide synthase [Aquiluna sp.]
MPVVGVIGAGQLARMMQPAAIALGIGIKVFAESKDSSAHQAVTKVGDINDFAQLLEFAKTVDVITFDHEHVPTAILEQLEAAGVSVRPGPTALKHAQNKLTMRRKLAELGLPQPIWQAAKTESDIANFLQNHGPKIVVKTPIGGYDGKGVRVVSAVEDVRDWLQNISQFGGELLLEEKVDFVTELAQLSARSPSGEFNAWPLVETHQQAGVCAEVIAPAPESALHPQALSIAKQISDGLGVVGVMAVELFRARNGEILVNELAMRPHNSGHFSIDASITSQFEQHLRAVLDMPLGATSGTSNFAVMINLLGVDSENDFVQHYPKAMERFPQVKFHMYEKAPRPGRKMGHLTLQGNDLDQLLADGRACRDLLYNR